MLAGGWMWKLLLGFRRRGAVGMKREMPEFPGVAGVGLMAPRCRRGSGRVRTSSWRDDVWLSLLGHVQKGHNTRRIRLVERHMNIIYTPALGHVPTLLNT